MEKKELNMKIKKFILERTKVKGQNVENDTPLISSGIVDSLLLAELILFVEELCGNEIEIDNFEMNSFQSINTIYTNYFTR